MQASLYQLFNADECKIPWERDSTHTQYINKEKSVQSKTISQRNPYHLITKCIHFTACDRKAAKRENLWITLVCCHSNMGNISKSLCLWHDGIMVDECRSAIFDITAYGLYSMASLFTRGQVVFPDNQTISSTAPWWRWYTAYTTTTCMMWWELAKRSRRPGIHFSGTRRAPTNPPSTANKSCQI